MSKSNERSGFTLIEVLIVVVIMAILAATVIPQFGDSTKDAKSSAGMFNLHMLREQIEIYKAQHSGKVPTATLAELISKTNVSGTIGTGAGFVYGPYISEVPDNPFTNKNTVTVTATAPPSAAGGSANAGWLYHVASGSIWLDDAAFLSR